eukprot:CAMPEP_0203659786 /NCGR_PEP_ID=MMETSP0088-20131115/53572_1 /ASSEMBLY_ACC=CAM_ASM_001087 /TAXON_ID=426623 /ORGANISM="Chaetoceros affinis, Strain CCMP159" /LENGTH=55 /DNA_ID=CAMNT_0050521929 /DNA_START=1 /DNA_END=168 /DNA_ORIENTATION=+
MERIRLMSSTMQPLRIALMELRPDAIVRRGIANALLLLAAPVFCLRLEDRHLSTP